MSRTLNHPRRMPGELHCAVNGVQSMYTGVYARGGPSVEQSSAVDLPHYLDRSEVLRRRIQEQKPQP